MSFVLAPRRLDFPLRTSRAVHDALILMRRNPMQYVRVPPLPVFSTIQPVMFVLLFVYVFGGAIKVPGGGNYVNFLMPGIIV